MKCIRNLDTGVISRVTDESAKAAVEAGSAEYCGKVTYKISKDPTYLEKALERKAQEAARREISKPLPTA